MFVYFDCSRMRRVKIGRNSIKYSIRVIGKFCKYFINATRWSIFGVCISRNMRQECILRAEIFRHSSARAHFFGKNLSTGNSLTSLGHSFRWISTRKISGMKTKTMKKRRGESQRERERERKRRKGKSCKGKYPRQTPWKRRGKGQEIKALVPLSSCRNSKQWTLSSAVTLEGLTKTRLRRKEIQDRESRGWRVENHKKKKNKYIFWSSSRFSSRFGELETTGVVAAGGHQRQPLLNHVESSPTYINTSSTRSGPFFYNDSNFFTRSHVFAEIKNFPPAKTVTKFTKFEIISLILENC